MANVKSKGSGYAVRIMWKLLGFTKPMVVPMAVAVVTGCLGFILSFGLGIFGGYGILSIVAGEGFGKLPFGGQSTGWYISAMIVCAALRGMLHYLEQLCNHFIAFRILAEIRGQAFSAMRRLAPAKLESKNKGSMIAVITADIELLEVFFAHTVSPLLIAFGTGIGIMVFFGMINLYMMALSLVFYLAVGILIPWQAGKKGNVVGLRLRNEIGNLNGQFLDALRGIKEVIQYNRGNDTIKDIELSTAELLDKQRTLREQGGTVSGLTDGMIVLAGMAMLLLGVSLVKGGRISVDEAFVASLTMISTFGPFIAIANLGNTLSHTLAAGERVLGILEEEPEVYPVSDGRDVDFDGVAIKNLSFGYGDKEIIKNLSLTINKGEILGIKGKSGSGKSTLLKLMMRFWRPSSGEICISGVGLENINTDSLLKNISYMTQETVLFSGSIAENLRIASKNASIEEMEKACDRAGILGHILSLPTGFDTQVAELGDNFSGGERQRLGLARCFLANAPLIFLDEPTSNLDSQNEALILRMLYREREGKTIVLVSHRESTLAIADRIFKM